MILYPDSFRFFNPIKSSYMLFSCPSFLLKSIAPSHSNSITMVKEFKSTTTPMIVSSFSLVQLRTQGDPRTPPKKNRTQLLDILQLYLVGGLPAPLKNMSSSVGMMKFPIYGKIKFMFQTTNQILAYSPFNHWVAAPLVQ